MYIYIYICIYTHTHIHTYTYSIRGVNRGQREHKGGFRGSDKRVARCSLDSCPGAGSDKQST